MITVKQFNEAKQIINNWYLQEYPVDKLNDIVVFENDREPVSDVFKNSIYLSMLKHFVFRKFGQLLMIRCRMKTKRNGYNVEEDQLTINIEIPYSEKYNRYHGGACCIMYSDIFLTEKEAYFSKDKCASYELFETRLTNDVQHIANTLYKTWKLNPDMLDVPKQWLTKNGYNVNKLKFSKQLTEVVKTIVEKHFRADMFSKKNDKEKNQVKFSFEIDEGRYGCWKDNDITINEYGVIKMGLSERFEGGNEESELEEELEIEIGKLMA